MIPFLFSEISSLKDSSGKSDIPKELENNSDEDDDDESYPALSDALTQLGLPEYVDLFESEEMDMETFVSLSLMVKFVWGFSHLSRTEEFPNKFDTHFSNF